MKFKVLLRKRGEARARVAAACAWRAPRVLFGDQTFRWLLRDLSFKLLSRGCGGHRRGWVCWSSEANVGSYQASPSVLGSGQIALLCQALCKTPHHKQVPGHSDVTSVAKALQQTRRAGRRRQPSASHPRRPYVPDNPEKGPGRLILAATFMPPRAVTSAWKKRQEKICREAQEVAKRRPE